MRKGLLAASLAGALVAPQIGAALASDSDRSIARAETRMLLPMPQQDSVPWLNTGFSLIVPKQYLMIGPRIDNLGPLLLPPAIPPTQFSSSARTSAPNVATE